jgi:hypothetical protein
MWRRKKPQRPICGCKHDLAFHESDGDGGGTVCHEVNMISTYNDIGDYIGMQPQRCTCRQYTGPRIMDPGYVARELRIDPR